MPIRSAYDGKAIGEAFVAVTFLYPDAIHMSEKPPIEGDPPSRRQASDVNGDDVGMVAAAGGLELEAAPAAAVEALIADAAGLVHANNGIWQ